MGGEGDVRTAVGVRLAGRVGEQVRPLGQPRRLPVAAERAGQRYLCWPGGPLDGVNRVAGAAAAIITRTSRVGCLQVLPGLGQGNTERGQLIDTGRDIP